MKPLLRRLPTTDLYFANALPHVAEAAGVRLPVVRQIGQHCYKVGRAIVVSRYVNKLEIALIRRLGAERIAYIIDDDLEAGISDAGLHRGYRNKLKSLRDNGHRRILEIATDIVVPSERLVRYYEGEVKVHRLHPLWHRPYADLTHFPPAVVGEGPFHMAFLGTRSHLQDLALIEEPLVELLRRWPKLELHLRLGREAPASLARLPNVQSAPQLGWRSYRCWIGTERFHLALYPLRTSSFNAARSSNKLFEHALTGAASAMSPMPAMTDLLQGALEEIFVADGADAWFKRMDGLIRRPLLAQTLAARTAMHLNALDIPAHHVKVWRDIIGV